MIVQGGVVVSLILASLVGLWVRVGVSPMKLVGVVKG